jgi:processive 1,2-diacylglycerol beta-glucosyltransferase
MKRILVLYSKTTIGKQRLAENIEASLKGEFDADLVDYAALDGAFARMEDGRRVLTKLFPGVWDFLYSSPLFHRLERALRRSLLSVRSGRLEKILADHKYDLVLASPEVASVVSYLKDKGWYQGKLVVFLSELYFHPTWLYGNADLYLATIAEQKEQMLSLGVAPEKIVVVGVTVPEKISVEPSNLVSLRNTLEIGDDQKVVLVLGGDKGLGISRELISEVQNTGAKILVLCGENVALKEKLKQDFSYDKNIVTLGFVENMDEMYQIANVVVTVPSVMVIAEALRFKLPIIISSTLTYQDRENYSLLTDKFLVFPDFVDVRGAVEDELTTGNFKRDLEANPNIDLIVQHGSTLNDIIGGM